MTRRMVFGDDGSGSSDLAWLWINSQAWPGWTIEVLSAQDPQGTGDATARPWEPEQPRVLLDPTSTTPVIHLRAEADPRTALANCADRDLLVIGPRGRGLLKSLHLGSTADWLLHDPTLPLIIARRGVPVRRAVVCADGSADSTAAAEALARMPWIGGVSVTVVSAAQPGIDPAQAADRTAALFADKAGQVRTEVARPTELDVFYHVRDLLLESVNRHQADLVVHGTRGLSGWEGLRLGSIATSLAYHAPCSVLVARAK